MTELVVCTTCLDGTGQALLELVENEALARDCPAPVRGMACLAACSRSCSAGLQGAGKASYVFGALTADETCAAALVEVAFQHLKNVEGALPWAERPERLKSAMLARLPASKV